MSGNLILTTRFSGALCKEVLWPIKKRKRTNEPIKNRVQSKRYVTLAKQGRHDWTGLVPEDVTLPWVPDAFFSRAARRFSVCNRA